MIDTIKRFFGKEKSSKSVAKERLQLVLVHDRSDCSPELVQKIKKDILNTLSEYIDINEEKFDIKINSSENGEKQSTLIANIPIRKIDRTR